jgi:hypothetical protein
LEDLGLDGRIILKWNFEEWDGGMNWIHLAQNKCKWQSLLNVAMNSYNINK